MTIRVDPEGNETAALFSMVDFAGKHILEIGSGIGRLTWRYAGKAGHVTGVESCARSVEVAKLDMPAELNDRVEFHQAGFTDYAASTRACLFDIALLSWSL
jgi:tRNA A58 N-methylase Trm61